MIIEDVPSIFQPSYKSNYPDYSSGLNMEEIFYEFFIKEKDTIITEYIYLPIFWTSYYVLNNYGENINPLLQYLNKLNKNKKYFTIVQYASGIYIDEPINNLTVFSAGGGGLNKKGESVREELFFNLKRHIFHGEISNYSIPLICYPLFPNLNINKHVYCSFMGRYDTHKCRIIMKNELQKYNNFKFYDSLGFNQYKEILNKSIFTLAPRGYGYTSFRIYEAILAGSIPIYIWENKKIIPFKEELNWNEFSVIIEEKDIMNLPNILKKCNIEKMQKKIQEVRDIFTFEGTYNYIKQKLLLK